MYTCVSIPSHALKITYLFVKIRSVKSESGAGVVELVSESVKISRLRLQILRNLRLREILVWVGGFVKNKN